jgi:hypothetical protein
MAHSVPAPFFRASIPHSSEAFLQAATSVGEVNALLERQNRDEQMMALAFIFGGPAREEIAPFAKALNQIRERWLQLHGRLDVFKTRMYQTLADVIGLNSQQRSLLDFLAQCPDHEPTMRHIVRTVLAIRVCSGLVQYEEFDSAWRCSMENEEPGSAFATKLEAARLDYVGDLRGMNRSNAEAEFRAAVALQLRDGVSPELQKRCRSVADIDRKLISMSASIWRTQHVLKALDHAWGGDCEPPFDFVFALRQAMNSEADGVDARLLRTALLRHLVRALPPEFAADYALATRSPDETQKKVAVLDLISDWLADPSRWQNH